MFNLFNFLAGEATTPADGTTTSSGGMDIVSIIVFGVIIVLLIGWMFLSNRKQKKAQADMKAKLGVGVTIMTIGGIIGEIVQMDAEYVWLSTGLNDQTCVMKFTTRAIHSVVDAPVSATGTPAENAEETVDEIK